MDGIKPAYALTFPSVTVRRVWITDSFVSRFGVSSKYFITVCTILVMACLSCPCFFERSRTWSLSRFQSSEFLLIVTIVMSNRDVVGKSLDYGITAIRI